GTVVRACGGSGRVEGGLDDRALSEIVTATDWDIFARRLIARRRPAVSEGSKADSACCALAGGHEPRRDPRFVAVPESIHGEQSVRHWSGTAVRAIRAPRSDRAGRNVARVGCAAPRNARVPEGGRAQDS